MRDFSSSDRLNRLWIPSSLLFKGYSGTFVGTKQPERDVDGLTLSSSDVKMELYLYSRYTPSECRQGLLQTLTSAGLYHATGWELHLLQRKKEVKAGAKHAVTHAASYYTASDYICNTRISTADKILIPPNIFTTASIRNNHWRNVGSSTLCVRISFDVVILYVLSKSYLIYLHRISYFARFLTRNIKHWKFWACSPSLCAHLGLHCQWSRAIYFAVWSYRIIVSEVEMNSNYCVPI
jgi:hypothetical protein